MGEYVLCERGFVPTITTVVEREMAQRVRYHPKLRAAEDVDFAIRLALEGCKFRMLEQPGAVWNDHDDSGRASARLSLSLAVEGFFHSRKMASRQPQNGFSAAVK